MDGIIVQPETSKDGTFKGRFRVRIIRAGLSGNGNFYADAVLREAAGLFEGVRVFVKSDQEHINGAGKDVRNLIGRITGVAFQAGPGPDSGELRGTFELIEPDGQIGTKIKEAWDRNMTDLFGFSIFAMGPTRRGQAGGKPVRILRKFSKVNSVDLIVDPGAGGEIINLIESKGTDPMEDEDDYLDGTEIRRIVEATRLPEAAKQKLITAHNPASEVTEASLREAINTEAEYLAKISDSGTVRGMGADMSPDRSQVRLIEGRNEKVASQLDAFFDPNDRSVQSIRECYLNITGDRGFTGQLRNCDEGLLRESLGASSFSDVLGDSIAWRVIQDYATPSIYDIWRNMVTVVPVNDFRVQERTRFGGYGDMPIVAEGDPYLALSSPTDEAANYAIAKRGGTEDLTLEMITNDDVGAVRQIPQKMVRASKRTLSKFVFDFVKDNAAIYDGVALFHATHNNLGAAALAAASVAAGRLAMKNQTELNSGEKLAIGPKFLWVPDELEETAVDLFRRNTEQDKNFIQSLSLEVMPVWCWPDTNDWALTADPFDIPVIEIGFLSGNEEPELFVQDSPTSGSMFTHDKMTFKIRHPYGGTVLDFRGAYKAVVA